MPSKKEKRSASAANLHICLLFADLLLCVLLMLCTIALQGYNLRFPPEPVTEVPSMLGEEDLPFQLTVSNSFPFLMLPMLLLVIETLYLQKFFLRNGFHASERIFLLEKWSYTCLQKKSRILFASVLIAVSFILCALTSVQHSLHTPWFGWLVVVATGYLYCFCAKQFRHRMRQYRRIRTEKKTS